MQRRRIQLCAYFAILLTPLLLALWNPVSHAVTFRCPGGDESCLITTMQTAHADADAILSVPDASHTYSFQSIDVTFPGASQTVVSAVNTWGQLVGIYQDAWSVTHGFVQVGRLQRILPNMVPQGINQAGLMTGWLSNQGQPGVQGFLMDRQSFVRLVFPDDGSGQFRPSLITEPIGLNDLGQVVGDYRDYTGQFRGFLYSAGVYYTIDAPFPVQWVSVMGIDNAGVMVGAYHDGLTAHGFIIDAAGFHTVDVPGMPWTQWNALDNGGMMVGTVIDAAGVVHGVVSVAGEMQLIDVPGAVLTETIGLNDQGWLVGRYLDSAGLNHGFVAKPQVPLVSSTR
jgi:hypothetical protein